MSFKCLWFLSTIIYDIIIHLYAWISHILIIPRLEPENSSYSVKSNSIAATSTYAVYAEIYWWLNVYVVVYDVFI